VGAKPTESPAAYRDGFVVATGQGVVAAVDNGGRLAWRQVCTNLSFCGAPAVAGGTVVACTGEGDVVALDLAAGAVRWQTRVEGSYLHGPLAMQQGGVWQVVMLCDTDGVMRCLDVRDGRSVWTSEPTTRSDGCPGVEGELLAYGNCDAAVHLFRATDGRHVAQVPAGEESQMAGATLVRGGRVYGGAYSAELLCVDAASTAVVWRAPAGDEDAAYATPVAVRDTVCIGSRGGTVFAFAARDGTVRWRADLDHAVRSLCAAGDTVVALSHGALVALRAEDGGTVARLAVGDDVKGPVWNGQVLAAVDDGGNLVGFRRRK
jgi:outer membrane protein assembly factor BamB